MPIKPDSEKFLVDVFPKKGGESSNTRALLTTRRLELHDTRTTDFEFFFKNKSKHSNQCSVEAVGQTRLASHRFLQRCCPQVLVGKGFAAMILRHYLKGRCLCCPCLEAPMRMEKIAWCGPFHLIEGGTQ